MLIYIYIFFLTSTLVELLDLVYFMREVRGGPMDNGEGEGGTERGTNKR